MKKDIRNSDGVRKRSNKKVVLLNPPLSFAETPLNYHPPLLPMGLAYLGASLEDFFSGGAWSRYFKDYLTGKVKGPYNSSNQVKVFDNNLTSYYNKFSLDELIKNLGEFFGNKGQDCIIGISIISDSVREAKRLIATFNEVFPKATIVVGGPHVTLYPYDFAPSNGTFSNESVQYIVKGEAEESIIGIVNDDLYNKESLNANFQKYNLKIAGCDYSDDNCRIIDSGQILDINKLSVPAFFLFEKENKLLPYEADTRYGLINPAINLNTSRGCPYKCIFCTIPSLIRGYRNLNSWRIGQMVRFVVDYYGINSIFFREDNFIFESKEFNRWQDITKLGMYLNKHNIKIRFAIEARGESIAKKLSRLVTLKKMGLTGIYIGVESGNNEMLKKYHKGSKLNNIDLAISNCIKIGINVVTSIVYSDSDLFTENEIGMINLESNSYIEKITREREELLLTTRNFLDKHNIPIENREEFVLLGIPDSKLYNKFKKLMKTQKWLIEYYDSESRYLYPKGFRWWATKIYSIKFKVRPYYDYKFYPKGS